MGIFNINDKITQYKKWRELIQRMDDDRLPKKIKENKTEGRRNIGRPHTSWEDDFREEEQTKGPYSC